MCPPWWNNPDEFGSSWLFGNEELRSKSDVGWSQRLRTAEAVLVGTGKEAGRRVVPGSVSANTAEARRRRRGGGGCPGHCCFQSFVHFLRGKFAASFGNHFYLFIFIVKLFKNVNIHFYF